MFLFDIDVATTDERAGAQAAGALADDAPEEAGDGAAADRGQVRVEEAPLRRVVVAVPGGAAAHLPQAHRRRGLPGHGRTAARAHQEGARAREGAPGRTPARGTPSPLSLSSFTEFFFTEFSFWAARSGGQGGGRSGGQSGGRSGGQGGGRGRTGGGPGGPRRPNGRARGDGRRRHHIHHVHHVRHVRRRRCNRRPDPLLSLLVVSTQLQSLKPRPSVFTDVDIGR